MAKVKLTKTALKQERDALKQFKRFLPTLQLKKQQLQLEMRTCLERIEQNKKKEAELKSSLASWTRLFGDGNAVERVAAGIQIHQIVSEIQNIAGVKVPVFEKVEYEPLKIDLFREDPWVDDAANVLKQIVSIRTERDIIRRQYELIGAELRTTTQRVNLFEKVKIPECLENIRTIGIYLGDSQTAAVARSKIAKKKLQEVVA